MPPITPRPHPPSCAARLVNDAGKGEAALGFSGWHVQHAVHSLLGKLSLHGGGEEDLSLSQHTTTRPIKSWRRSGPKVEGLCSMPLL